MNSLPNVPPLPALGYGLGLRPPHYHALCDEGSGIDWLEIISENYMGVGGRPMHWLDRLRERYPMVMHGVSLSIGGTDPLDKAYLQQLKQLERRVRPAWVSDHLCWTGVHGVQLHDLMPLPYTEETLRHVVGRVRDVQDALGRPLVLENVSSYVRFAGTQMAEWEFLAALSTQADCLLLLDINNVFVSAHNHGFSARDFIDGVPAGRVQQFHLAGHESGDRLIIDTHDAPVTEDVWSLYAYAVQRFGKVSTLIERDDDIPPLEVLRAELARARGLAQPVRAAA